MTDDIFNYADRAGFLERLGRLGGQTTFREPSGGGSPYSARMMTAENKLTMALVFGRRRIEVDGVMVPDKRDIGPEIAYSIGTGIPDHREKVVSWLAIKIMRDAGPKGRKAQNYINILSQHCYEMVAFGKQVTKLPSRLPVCWDQLRAIGIGWLWIAAESTIERAEYAHKADGKMSQRDKRDCIKETA